MTAIFRREVAAYFNSFMAWVLMAVYVFVLGQMFLQLVYSYADYSLTAGSSPFGAPTLSVTDRVIVPTFWWMGFLLLFLLPLLTMRLFSEEIRTGTLEMLFTYPLTERDIVLGKFLGALSVVLAMMTMSATLFIGLGQLAHLEWKILLSGFFGIFLVSCNFISFGMWASSLSSSQLVTAAISYGGLLMSWLVAFVVRNMEGVKDVFGELSVLAHLEQMAKGMLSTHQLVYYVAWTSLFIFLTIRTLESRKWGS